MKQYRQFQTGWILAVLFLFGQMYFIVHESEHENNIIHAYCQVCLSTSVLNGAAPPSLLTIEPNHYPGIVTPASHSEPITSDFATAEARAPPFFS